MRSSWVGLAACVAVIYFGVVHGNASGTLLNHHALILVLGGTLAISLLTYSFRRLLGVLDYVLFGFLFRAQSLEKTFASDLLVHIDKAYGRTPALQPSAKVHLFIIEAMQFTLSDKKTLPELHSLLLSRRNALKRRYFEDAKILNNIAKYPPHLGLLGAASGMIQMMAGLGKVGVEIIGLSMATALTATLWGVGMNNFVFLPLADNAMKAAEDEIYLRDIVIECCLMIKKGRPHREVVNLCLNKLTMLDRAIISSAYIARYKFMDGGLQLVADEANDNAA